MSNRSFFNAVICILAGFGLLLGCSASGSDDLSDIDAGDTDMDAGHPDSGLDSGPDADDQDTETTIDTDTQTDTGPEELAQLAEKCWTTAFSPWHPNKDEPRCIVGLTCIGDDVESWCTYACDKTGDINDSEPIIAGWCCGQRSEPCNPTRYWMPMPPGSGLSRFCIPHTAGLAEPCDDDPTEWTGDNERCEPICDGDETLVKTVCARHDTDTGTFCTYPCDTDGDTEIEHDECLINPAFANGCCGKIMGGQYCLIPELCE